LQSEAKGRYLEPPSPTFVEQGSQKRLREKEAREPERGSGALCRGAWALAGTAVGTQAREGGRAMKLYDFALAPNPRKVRIYLAEKGIDIPRQEINLAAGEQRSPEFLKINPLGQVPVLELDDGSHLPESLAIIEYLEELHPDPPLLGTDPVSRARIRAAERACEFGVLLPAAMIFQHTSQFFAKRIRQIPEVAETAKGMLAKRWALLDERLANQEWLCGAYSIADITLLVGVDFAAASGVHPDPSLSHLLRWHRSASARPSAKA